MVFHPAVPPCHQHVARLAFVLGHSQVEARNYSAAAAHGGELSPPNRGGHPVEAEDGYAGRPHVLDGHGDVLDLLIAPWPPEHRVFIEGVGYVLDRLEAQPIALHLFPQGHQVGQLPASLPGQIGCVQLDCADAQLAGEGEVLVRRPGGLSEPNSYRHSSGFLHVVPPRYQDPAAARPPLPLPNRLYLPPAGPYSTTDVGITTRRGAMSAPLAPTLSRSKRAAWRPSSTGS